MDFLMNYLSEIVAAIAGAIAGSAVTVSITMRMTKQNVSHGSTITNQKNVQANGDVVGRDKISTSNRDSK